MTTVERAKDLLVHARLMARLNEEKPAQWSPEVVLSCDVVIVVCERLLKLEEHVKRLEDRLV